jgi:hypothetical protein
MQGGKYARQWEAGRQGSREAGREPGWDSAIRTVTLVRTNASPTGEPLLDQPGRVPAKQPALEEIIDLEGSDEVVFEMPLL